MARWHCLRCGALYTPGAPCCPQCRSAVHDEEDEMGKISSAGTVSERAPGQAAQDAPVTSPAVPAASPDVPVPAEAPPAPAPATPAPAPAPAPPPATPAPAKTTPAKPAAPAAPAAATPAAPPGKGAGD